jgi:hypothetical protein
MINNLRSGQGHWPQPSPEGQPEEQPGQPHQPERHIDFDQSIKREFMNTEQQMEERLWDYLDHLSSPTEISAIEELIAANREWQRRYNELLAVHQVMNGSDLEAPSMRFTKNVMEEIARYQVAPATKNYINKNIIRSIGAFFLLMILGFFIYCVGQFKWSGGGNSSGSSTFIPQYNLNVEKFNPGRIFTGAYANAFVLIMAVLTLVFLDMYLQNKKRQAGHKEA